MIKGFFEVLATEDIGAGGLQQHQIDEISDMLDVCSDLARKNLLCFDIEEIRSFATDLAQDFMSEDTKLPSDLKIPGDCCVFHSPKIGNAVYLFKSRKNEYAVAAVVNRVFYLIGSIDLKTKTFMTRPVPDHPEVKLTVIVAYVLAYVVILTNNKIINIEQITSRNERRFLKTKLKIKCSIGKIRWNVNHKVSVSKRDSDPLYHLPLHWRRGYWRKSKENHPKSEQRPNALNPHDRLNWWTWVDGYWAGHPAYGFKKSVYQPYIGGQNNAYQ